MIPTAADFALVAEQAARFKPVRKPEQPAIAPAALLEVERKGVDEIDYPRGPALPLDAPRHARELDVDQVVALFAKQAPDLATHSGGFMHGRLHWAPRQHAAAEPGDHSCRAMRYHDDFLAQARGHRAIRGPAVGGKADQGYLVTAAQEAKLMVGPNLVAAQRGMREFRCDEENSHRASTPLILSTGLLVRSRRGRCPGRRG